MGLVQSLHSLINLRSAPLEILIQLVKHIIPDGLPRGVREPLVPNRDVYARHERLVESAHAVRSEEQDPPEVVERAQENGHDAVALQVVDGARFQVDVGFVDEDHGVPVVGVLEEAEEVLLEVLRVFAEVGGGEVEEGALGVLGDGLWG